MQIEITQDELESIIVQLMVRRNELAELWQNDVPGTCVHEEHNRLVTIIYKLEGQLHGR